MRRYTHLAFALLALGLSACGAKGVDRELAACPPGPMYPLNATRWDWHSQPGVIAAAPTTKGQAQ